MGDGVDGPSAMTFTPPAGLGAFTFPAPYSSRGIRLTNASNAVQGCQPRSYSYWSSCNNHAGRPNVLAFLGRLGQSPIIVSVDKASGAVSPFRELPWVSTGEGCYFSDTDADRLYFLDGNRLSYLLVNSGEVVEVFTLDPKFGNDLWQAHSSSNDQVHSATVRRRTDSGPYEVLGSVVFKQGKQTFIPRRGDFDECQIDKSGRWLVIQEDNNNRIIDLASGTEHTITNADGALAHLDCGAGVMVGEDDQHEPSACVLWHLDTMEPRRVLYTTVWGPGMGHVSVRPGVALLSSNATGELIRVPLDGSRAQPIAPGLIDGSDYDHQLRANLDPVSEFACWIAFIGTRFDAFLVPLLPFSPPTVTPPDPKPPTQNPGGSMKALTIFAVPDDALVILRHDSGAEFTGVPGTADGRPAKILNIDDELVSRGHGAELTIDWDGQKLTQHGFLRPSPNGQAEFIGDVFRKPEGF